MNKYLKIGLLSLTMAFNTSASAASTTKVSPAVYTSQPDIKPGTPEAYFFGSLTAFALVGASISIARSVSRSYKDFKYETNKQRKNTI